MTPLSDDWVARAGFLGVVGNNYVLRDMKVPLQDYWPETKHFE
jgi:hypothetical protein